MSLRLRLYDVRLSDLPQVLGLCQADVRGVASVVNTVQRRLLFCREAGDESWYGTWAEIGFNLDRATPYFTLPREIARLESVAICNRAVPVRNQFFEYNLFGNGRLPKTGCGQDRPLSVLSRNNTVTFNDLVNPPKIIRVYATSALDSEKRVLIQGIDPGGNTIYSLDGSNNTQGQFLALESPFVDFPIQLQQLTGIQKDITIGPVQFYQVDPTSGEQSLLLTMEPGEQTASYRRYYFNALPSNCCPGQTSARATAIVKLALLPVVVDTDYCLLQNLEAMIEEAQAVRYSRVDNLESKQMAQEKHSQAVRLLNGELSHWLGKNDVAINFAPFGSARLERVKIGMI